MAIIKDRRLEQQLQDARTKGYQDGYANAVQNQIDSKVYGGISTPSIPAHADLDLVIDAFSLRHQYPTAQDFYDDLVASKTYRDLQSAAARIDSAAN